MSPVSPSDSKRLPGRVLEWLWRGDAQRAARRDDDAARSWFFCEQRARISAEVGRRTLEPSSPWLAGDASHLAAAHFAESIGWSLRLSTGRVEGAISHQPADRAELLDLIEAEREPLQAAAGDEETLARVVESLLERRFEAQELSRQDCERSARELGAVADALLSARPARVSAEDKALLQRATRLALLALAAAGLIVGSVSLRNTLERRSELSVGKAWTTSSQYDTGCISPAQACGSGKSYFFHTQEERNPWIQFDLGKAERVSKLRIVNREDCCAERAIPLVVELSVDGKKWLEVGRQKSTFEEWTTQWSSVHARYVRLRIARRSTLHLKEVHIF